MHQKETVSRSKRKLKKSESTILEYHRSRKRVGPTFTNITSDVACQKKEHHLSGRRLDMMYAMMRFFQPGRVPTWTGFNTLMHTSDELVKSKIGYLPVLEASPTEMNTVVTIMSRSVHIANVIRVHSVVIVLDQAIYSKVQEIRWSSDEFKDRLVVRLGEFHTCMHFLGVIGKRFGSAGLFDILVESGVVAHGSVNAVLDGKHYNRAVRAHKVVFETVERLRFGAYLESLTEKHRTRIRRLMSGATDLFPSDAFSNLMNGPDVSDILENYMAFIEKRSDECKTFAFWSSYIEMVELLLLFIRATRTSDWQLHLSTLRSMVG